MQWLYGKVGEKVVGTWMSIATPEQCNGCTELGILKNINDYG
jgi:hypothetical protein